MATMILAENLVKHYGHLRAVDGLSFEACEGEVLGFLGPNGAGKSTTMRILTTFVLPDAGRAEVGGYDVVRDPLKVRELVGYLPEAAPVYGEMEVGDYLEFVGRVRGFSGRSLAVAVDRVIERCKLAAVRGQPVETLSKGFKRRTVLAQAIIHDPKVLILDEPTDGLDPNQKFEVRNLIAEMRTDKCIVISTHILEEVDAVCSRAIIIDRGRVAADCTPEELKRRSPLHGTAVVTLLGVAPEVAAETFSRVEGVVTAIPLTECAEECAKVRLTGAGSALPLAAVAEAARVNGWALTGLHVEEGSLEEVFRSLTRQEEDSNG